LSPRVGGGWSMAEGFQDLPVLGVGASLSLEARPDPVALVSRRGGPSFVEYAGRLDVDEVLPLTERVRAAGAPVLFHPSYINFCGSFANSQAWLEETARHVRTVASPWFAQDLAYCFVAEGQGYSAELGYFVPPILNRASLERALARVQEVQAVVPVPVAIEPPPMTFAVGRMPLFEFFGELAERADCAILLDMGHLVSYEVASGERVLAQLERFPCERVIELHIAGGRMETAGSRSVYVDAHERDILPSAWEMLDALLPRLPGVRAVCFECEGASEEHVLTTLARLRQTVIAKSRNAELVHKVEDER
jgi:uncharacterized protein (UPF0276 family)